MRAINHLLLLSAFANEFAGRAPVANPGEAVPPAQDRVDMQDATQHVRDGDGDAVGEGEEKDESEGRS